MCEFSKDEAARNNESCKRLRVEAEKCLAQSERFSKEKVEFESEIYSKVRCCNMFLCYFIMLYYLGPCLDGL